MDNQTRTTCAERLIALLLYSIAVAPSDHIYASALALPIALGVALRSDLLITLKRLIALNIFILVLAASLALEGQNDLALLVFARSNLILFVSLALFARADSLSVAAGFSRLRAPKKLVAALFFSAKIAHLLKAEFKRFKRALYLRGYKLKANMTSYRLIASFTGLLLIRCFDRAEALKKTMILRGFNGEIPTLNKPRLALASLAFAAIAALSFLPFFPLL
ncbi:MAG: energy-coupling factor transporter transmembrane protein EcfT [Helicobacteraceae bacterium]|jgi:cobalt/nickel transport system permease protein|nr:energy-coupling factor transporter transmembrane protein EcfT [Helicobacteraceae bacterium]